MSIARVAAPNHNSQQAGLRHIRTNERFSRRGTSDRSDIPCDKENSNLPPVEQSSRPCQAVVQLARLAVPGTSVTYYQRFFI